MKAWLGNRILLLKLKKCHFLERKVLDNTRGAGGNEFGQHIKIVKQSSAYFVPPDKIRFARPLLKFQRKQCKKILPIVILAAVAIVWI